MLPAASRLRRSDDFRRTVRRGRRAATGTLVVHLIVDEGAGSAPAQVGFVVGRSVGGSVVRSRTTRRLRHIARARLASLPAASILVVRALPAAAAADSATLTRDFDRGLERVLAPARGRR